MLSINRLNRESQDRPEVEKLYFSAFPEIERHTLDELFEGCDTGKAEWLVFRDGEEFIGLAYMIINDGIAFILYLAVEESHRNRGYGSAILREISDLYVGMEEVLLMESLYEECDNMDIRRRRKGFYMRNGFHDTGYIQSTCEGQALFDILSTREDFSTERWQTFSDHYPMESYMDDYYKAEK